MRILVTGTSGQVGGALAERVVSHGTLISADRALLDLTYPERLSAQLDDLAPDIIINPAAYTAVDKAETERDLAMHLMRSAGRARALGREARRSIDPFFDRLCFQRHRRAALA